MKQTKLESFIEASVNTCIGLCITSSISYPLYWWFEVEISHAQIWGITAVMTLVSVARGYVIRRFFNNLEWLKTKIKDIVIAIKTNYHD